MTSEYKPDIVTLKKQALNFGFSNIEKVVWKEENDVPMYNATIKIGVHDIEKMIERFFIATDDESHIFLEYKGFRDAMPRRVRIIDCQKSTIETANYTKPAVLFQVVLNQEDLDDFQPTE